MTLILSGTDGLSDVDGTAAAPAIRGTDTNTGIFFPAANTVAVSNGGIESYRTNSSGNVLIGASTNISGSTSRVQVTADGTSRASDIYVPSTGTYGQIGFNNPNGQVGLISTNGSATTYATSSDYRLKNTIAPMTGALDKVALLKPCTYKWNVDGSDGQGFIAHELQEVVEGCVTGAKDAVDADGNPQYQGIDTSFLVATLTAAIQELKAIVDTQAARITALEAA